MRSTVASLALVVLLVGSGCGATSTRGPASASATYVASPGAGFQVDDDVRAGYARYAGVLAGRGDWFSDPMYGEYWCPGPMRVRGTGLEGFQPYRTAGHWRPGKPGEGVGRGAPMWVSDDRASWLDITLHHGWWVEVPERGRRWCWLPGVDETAGHLVWREADGIVAWEPEPVFGSSDPGQDGRAWTYCSLVDLFDEDLRWRILTGQQAEDATEAMCASTSPATERGPTRSAVEEATRRGPVALRSVPPGACPRPSPTSWAGVQAAPAFVATSGGSGSLGGIGGMGKLLVKLALAAVGAAHR